MRVSDYDLVVVGSGPAGQTVGRQANGDQLHLEAAGLATSRCTTISRTTSAHC
jgi:pyruvate/2-oxoglutarate dehydrogenase complex dihydrolipoamide dehydrogenase (E3) component